MSAAQRLGLIALGSNLGDRADYLRQAAVMIDALPDTEVLAVAPLYETAPVDCADSVQSFYNSVIEIRSALPALELLHACQQIEVQLGRPQQHGFHQPRTIDIDLLDLEGAQYSDPELELPHPRMLLRRFVLQPAADLCPDWVVTTSGATLEQHLEAFVSDEPELKFVALYWNQVSTAELEDTLS